MITTVTDGEILYASKMLAEREGIFVEPASAASFAGVLKLSRRNYFRRGRVVCVLTGHGLKDPETALKQVKQPRSVKPDFRAIVDQIL